MCSFPATQTANHMGSTARKRWECGCSQNDAEISGSLLFQRCSASSSKHKSKELWMRFGGDVAVSEGCPLSQMAQWEGRSCVLQQLLAEVQQLPCHGSCWRTLGLKLSRLAKTFKIMSNHQPITTVFTTKSCHRHLFLEPFRDGDCITSLPQCFTFLCSCSLQDDTKHSPETFLALSP